MFSFDFNEWRVCDRWECRDTDVLSGLGDRFSAHLWITSLRQSALQMMELRSRLTAHGYSQIATLSDEDALALAAELVASGVFHVHVPPAPTGSATIVRSEPEKSVPFPLSERKPRAPSAAPFVDRVEPPPPKKKTWIEFQLIDDEGNPVPSEKYNIKLPDGSIRSGTLDDQGLVRFDDIDPGHWSISFPEIEPAEWRAA